MTNRNIIEGYLNFLLILILKSAFLCLPCTNFCVLREGVDYF